MDTKPLNDREILAALEAIPSDKLGDLLKEYVRETLHNNWDGHAPRSVNGSRNLLRDLILFCQNYVTYGKQP